MLANTKRVYVLADFTIEVRGEKYYFARTARFGDKHELRGPYSSVASVALMIARELMKEIAKRDGPYRLPT